MTGREAMRRGWRHFGIDWELEADCGRCLVREMPQGNWYYEYEVSDRLTRAFGATPSFGEAVRHCEDGIGFGGRP